MIRRSVTTTLARCPASSALGRQQQRPITTNQLHHHHHRSYSSSIIAKAATAASASKNNIIHDVNNACNINRSSRSCLLLNSLSLKDDNESLPLSGRQQQYRSNNNLRFFSSSSQPVVHNNQDDDEIPSNLVFDSKSSFAPKPKPLVVVVPDDNQDDDEDELEEEIEEGKVAKRRSSNDDDEEDEEEEIEDYDERDYDFDDDDDIVADHNIDDSTVPRYVIPLPDRLKVTIRQGLTGDDIGTIWLNETIWGINEPRIDLIKQNIVYIRNKIRGFRKAKTKTISERSGSGRKVRQQKGTGSARAGHSRPAHWRGGAKAHGPKNTVNYGNIKMNKKQKKLAIRSMLSQKLKENNVIIVDNFNLQSHKTSPLSKLLSEAYNVGKDKTSYSALILDHYIEENDNEENDNGDSSNKNDNDNANEDASYQGIPINLYVASNNIPKIKIMNQSKCNTYDIILKDKLILTLNALKQIESRWKE